MTEYKLFEGCVIGNRIPFLEASSRKVLDKIGVQISSAPFACCPDPTGIKSFDNTAWLALGARNLCLAEAEGKVVGFCCGSPNDHEPTKDKYQYELKKIYILKEFHGQGIGSKLVGEFVTAVKELGYNSLFLWVLRTNPYRKFYDKLGGKVVAEKEYHPAGHVLKGDGYGCAELNTLCSKLRMEN